MEDYYNHYLDCYKRCLLIDSSLSSLETATEDSYFPVIIGRKPSAPLREVSCLQGKENISSPLSPPVVKYYSKIQKKKKFMNLNIILRFRFLHLMLLILWFLQFLRVQKSQIHLEIHNLDRIKLIFLVYAQQLK